MIRGEICFKSDRKENKVLSEPGRIFQELVKPPRTDKCGVITKALSSDTQAFAYGGEHHWRHKGVGENQSQGIKQFAQRGPYQVVTVHTPIVISPPGLTRSSATFPSGICLYWFNSSPPEETFHMFQTLKLYHIHFSYKFFKDISTLLSLLFPCNSTVNFALCREFSVLSVILQ